MAVVYLNFHVIHVICLPFNLLKNKTTHPDLVEAIERGSCWMYSEQGNKFHSYSNPYLRHVPQGKFLLFVLFSSFLGKKRRHTNNNRELKGKKAEKENCRFTKFTIICLPFIPSKREMPHIWDVYIKYMSLFIHRTTFASK